MARTKGATDSKPRKPRSDKKNQAGAPAEGTNTGQALPVLDDPETGAVYVHMLAELEEFIKVKDGAVSAIRNHRAKMETRGFSARDIDFGLRLRKGDDKEEVKRRSREQQLARWLNHPIGTQPDLFDERVPENKKPIEPIDEKVFRDGEIVGKEGKSCAPPTNLTGPLMEKWIQGWHRGQELLLASGITKLVPQEHPKPEGDAFDETLEDQTAGGDGGQPAAVD
jgi:hypothetical protein